MCWYSPKVARERFPMFKLILVRSRTNTELVVATPSLLHPFNFRTVHDYRTPRDFVPHSARAASVPPSLTDVCLVPHATCL